MGQISLNAKLWQAKEIEESSGLDLEAGNLSGTGIDRSIKPKRNAVGGRALEHRIFDEPFQLAVEHAERDEAGAVEIILQRRIEIVRQQWVEKGIAATAGLETIFRDRRLIKTCWGLVERSRCS